MPSQNLYVTIACSPGPTTTQVKQALYRNGYGRLKDEAPVNMGIGPTTGLSPTTKTSQHYRDPRRSVSAVAQGWKEPTLIPFPTAAPHVTQPAAQFSYGGSRARSTGTHTHLVLQHTTQRVVQKQGACVPPALYSHGPACRTGGGGEHANTGYSGAPGGSGEPLLI